MRTALLYAHGPLAFLLKSTAYANYHSSSRPLSQCAGNALLRIAMTRALQPRWVTW